MAQEIPTSWELYFSPNGGCTEAIIKELDKARTTIHAQAYSFTSAPIAKALEGRRDNLWVYTPPPWV